MRLTFYLYKSCIANNASNYKKCDANLRGKHADVYKWKVAEQKMERNCTVRIRIRTATEY